MALFQSKLNALWGRIGGAGYFTPQGTAVPSCQLQRGGTTGWFRWSAATGRWIEMNRIGSCHSWVLQQWFREDTLTNPDDLWGQKRPWIAHISIGRSISRQGRWERNVGLSWDIEYYQKSSSMSLAFAGRSVCHPPPPPPPMQDMALVGRCLVTWSRNPKGSRGKPHISHCFWFQRTGQMLLVPGFVAQGVGSQSFLLRLKFIVPFLQTTLGCVVCSLLCVSVLIKSWASHFHGAQFWL